MYKVVWRYKVKPELVDQFQEMYDTSGDWVRLFQKSPEFIKTELFQISESNAIFMTVDYWISKDAYETFYAKHKPEIDLIDKRGEGFTIGEEKIAEAGD